MINKELGEKSLQYIKNSGADKAFYHLVKHEKVEINFNSTSVGLFRTTDHNEVTLKAIKNNKISRISLTNIYDEEALKQSAKTLIEMCEASEEDINNDIAEFQEPEKFSSGSKEADKDKIYTIIEKLLTNCKEKYPAIKLNESFICFNKEQEHFMNSNGIDFVSSVSEYTIRITYAAKEGEKSSSFNGIDLSVTELPDDLLEFDRIRESFEESIEQLNCKSINGKFTGSIIITPDCLVELISTYNNIFLSDSSLITKTSRLKDKLNEKVASDSLTISCSPTDEDISKKVFVTDDGLKTQEGTYIENGVLKSYLLTLYGAKKTGLELRPTAEIIKVKPGEKSLDDIIKSTDRGIILGRFSGGNPASNGDFSGVAKNSYYVEDGEVKFPLIETMVSGNLYEIFNSIEDISKEVINMGYAVLPWVKVNGVVASGK